MPSAFSKRESLSFCACITLDFRSKTINKKSGILKRSLKGLTVSLVHYVICLLQAYFGQTLHLHPSHRLLTHCYYSLIASKTMAFDPKIPYKGLHK